MSKLIKRIIKLFRPVDPVGVSDTAMAKINEYYSGVEKSHKDAGGDNNIPDPIIYGNTKSNKIMLLVDDLESVFYLYDRDFEDIKERFGYDVLTEFKIVRCDGRSAGVIASNYIANVPNTILLGILDLTLGTIIKKPCGGTKLYDGVDLALELITNHPMCKIGFCTAHMLTNDNPAITELVEKFTTETGHNLLDYTYSKNSDRAKHIYDLIKSINDGNYISRQSVTED